MTRSSNRAVAWIIIGLAVACELLCLCAVVVGGIFWYFDTQQSPQVSSPFLAGPQVGVQAPDFTVELLDGQQVMLSEYRGKPVFVNFWATWCTYCVEEMPMIQEQYALYADELVFLVIDEGDLQRDVSDFVQDAGYPFPVALDPDYIVGDLYLVEYIPASYFIDSEGVLRYIIDGMMEPADMVAGLQAIGVE